ncbi:hypothetical protein ACVNHC_05470 [Pannonibacter sp. Q-1]
MLNLINFVQSLGDAATKSAEAQVGGSQSGRLDKTAKIVSIIANIAVIIVAILAYQQYVNSNEDLKRGRSLAFVQEWTEKGLSSAYDDLSLFVEERRIAGETLPADLSPEAITLAKFNLGQKWTEEIVTGDDMKSKSLERGLKTIVQFFSRMSTCESSGLCDSDVLVKYFDSELLTFWSYFRAYAALRQVNGYSGYGDKVDSLVAAFCEHKKTSTAAF